MPIYIPMYPDSASNNVTSLLSFFILYQPTGQNIDLRDVQAIDVLGDVVECARYTFNPDRYGCMHNAGHNQIADLGNGVAISKRSNILEEIKVPTE